MTATEPRDELDPYNPDQGPSRRRAEVAPPQFTGPYRHPAAGWGAAKSVGAFMVLGEKEPVSGSRAILKMNHENGGFDCPGCAWPDSIKGTHLDICENGIKHVTWEMTHRRVKREFFDRHTVSELATWSSYDLEHEGRLTEPMVYDPATDKYVPIGWPEALELVGRALRELDDPNQAAFYTSGRLPNEPTFLYQQLARELGTNNLPDCSNMCHEASGRALQASLGTGKGTCDLEDWSVTDALFILGVNAASNAPRMLTALADAHRRGAQIVHINPFVEAGAKSTIIPHEFVEMAMFHATPTSTLNIQPVIAGDFALLRGIAKAVLETSETDDKALDHEFIERWTEGFDAYAALLRATPWPELVEQSGVEEAVIRQAARIYTEADRAIISWCLGITQVEHSVDTIREIVNLLLLRGNLGREGAGPSPIRGHSNVQGNRTCGIDNNPTAEFLDRLGQVTGIEPPRAPGYDVNESIRAMHAGAVKVFVGMGNFAAAAPDTAYTFEALRNTELTVQISTKLNRSHVVHGKRALILPTLGHTEKDFQRSGLQVTTVEDSMAMVHRSEGMRTPPAPDLRSETAIIGGIAMAALPDSPTPWQEWIDDYDRIRDVMAKVIDGFEDYNRRVRLPLGFRIRQPARELVFLTPSGKAEFSAAPLPDLRLPAGRYRLSTMRSHDQWNTTVYSYNDRYRGVKNLRTLIFMNPDDMADRGWKQGDHVDVTSHARDGSTRTVRGYRLIPYPIPRGCVQGYMPELNVLIAIGDTSTQSDQPLMKNIPVSIEASA
ncbi:FdhF/YdeP family oxidoreductase [Nocardia stercoris]|uniref:Formate dehydrogenase n=1 Tax=Nocardia stercoris TaxID=2483361 RepID=A0A3M2LBM2_9NOCA|nr:FdhF/YdeP family oxidoreductase [Nocardia stercoris]RMI34130.1 formate dehydrogenase [Nocardia stercoris]